MVWEFIFLMVVLKIPIVYLCLVVYWAVRGDGRPAEGAALVAVPELGPRPDPWSRRPRRRRPGPHGSPVRSYARARRPVAGAAPRS
jgi:hypothetical protein